MDLYQHPVLDYQPVWVIWVNPLLAAGQSDEP